MSLFSSRTRSSASPKTDLGSTIDSQVLTPGLAPEGLGQGTRAASTMTAMPGAGIAAQLAPSRVIDTAAPIDAAPQRTASSQNFTDLGIPNESQLRAVGFS
jgi:hypothetical protein